MGAISTPQLGLGLPPQSWQNVSASRAVNTVYQNTTGKPILLVTENSQACAHFVDINPACTVQVAINSYPASISLVIPHGYYYKVGSGTANPSKWSELR